MSVMRDRIEALHGERTLKKSALRIRDGAGVFERVLSGKGYRTVLEIGTYRGVSAAEMSQYCERVITIDLRNGEAFDRVAFWNSLGLTNIELHLVEHDGEKEALIRTLEFDFAFIDGAHDYASVSKDFAMVKRCGCALFHDYEPGNYVHGFVNTLPKEQVQVLDIFAMWTAV